MCTVARRHHSGCHMSRARRRTTIGGQFAPRLIEMLRSPAFRYLSLSGRRALDRLEIEMADHGGTKNGELIVTYGQFAEYGMDPHAVAPALREVTALGLVEVTVQGRGGNAEYRAPSQYRLTYRHTDRAEPTHDWRKVVSDEQAQLIVRAARKASEKTKSRCGKNHFSMRETHSEIGKGPLGETHSTSPLGETHSTLDISGREDAA